MSDTPVDEITVVGSRTFSSPVWGWGPTINFQADDYMSSAASFPVQAEALSYAQTKVVVDPSLSKFQPALAYEADIENIVATLYYIAKQTGDKVMIDQVGSSRDITGTEFLSMLDRTAFKIRENAPDLPSSYTQAYTRPDGSQRWEISIDPKREGIRFNDTQLNRAYVILHELSHATETAVGLSKFYAVGGYTEDERRSMEEYANRYAAELAKSAGWAFPTEQQLIDWSTTKDGFPDESWRLPALGTSRADVIGGSGGSDSLAGLEGDDILVGSGGGDLLAGDDGTDTVSYAMVSNAATVNLATSTGDVAGAQDTLRQVENVTGSAYSDHITGSGGANVLAGEGGNDTIAGGLGADSINGGDGADYLHGNADDDFVTSGLGNDVSLGGQGNDTIRGGQGDDTLYGDMGFDFLSGDRGSDVLTGGGGADIFNTFSDAGLDTVLDFNLADGDRIRVEYGSYNVYQSGADTHVDFGNGSMLVLKNVSYVPPAAFI